MRERSVKIDRYITLVFANDQDMLLCAVCEIDRDWTAEGTILTH